METIYKFIDPCEGIIEYTAEDFLYQIKAALETDGPEAVMGFIDQVIIAK